MLSVVNSLLVVMRENLVLRLMKSKGEINDKVWLFQSHRFGQMMTDCCVMYLQPYPFLVGRRVEIYNHILGQNIYYHWNDVLHVLLLLRLVFFLNITFEISR
jgi:hypothetical protein